MAQTSKISKNNTKVMRDDEVIRVVLHGHEIVTVDKHKIRLDTCGWNTVTTKTRMMQASNELDLGYHVQQVDGTWYVSYRGIRREFEDNVCVLARNLGGIEELKRDAEKSCHARGHKNIIWRKTVEPTNSSWSREVWQGYCIECYGFIQVDNKPVPNECDICGAACALNCATKKFKVTRHDFEGFERPQEWSVLALNEEAASDRVKLVNKLHMSELLDVREEGK